MSVQSLSCGCDPVLGVNCAAHAPAFPSGKIDCGDCWEDWPHRGVTARDYFAAHAMQGLLSAAAVVEQSEPVYSRLAQFAYNCADAMLAAREQGGT